MTAPIRARLGPAIESQLALASANTSAALRAYVLLGIAATGQDMAPFRREIARALAEELAPEVLAALASLGGGRTGVGQVTYNLPPTAMDAGGRGLDDYPAAEELADPFLAGLVEV